MYKLTFFFLLALGCVSASAQTSVSKKALEIQNSAIVVDTHADTPQRFLDETYDIEPPTPKNPATSASTRQKLETLARSFSPFGSNRRPTRGISRTTRSI